ncbi:hypothetical protein A2715_02145 [Candidatus Woesebacteria bacterium RIFCSPHIGHO2_01_FULL_39_32]|uniref:Putative gluconeogenesis factor n=2 Tax=Candidatus Woeseibacteriota TaxID=1752722 RepID=A0A0G0S7S2_9BACT|nr:MAG: hypothetical protein UT61_C0002G0034 [Candidatus Woesebacteria bacterium GW2011_GWA1_39_8]OGM03459.1 MAG: hypothetical protein A2124_02380 [Candidatus Woesebacteria bacterium GWB1_37_5]OGM23956.1 MAG: hypothetical protein A2715_02145 [Candidatus Woesebacteria bacterium RIFCSPHIGHO2_01_FULL_39_32]OGM37462.1 MAG: hypothetical protein A3F01_03380 [Candidatus Woesebacteria bacterium RIFCSPHIGHO2_12_FULL_38_11]OGM64145.1 MAG: hypothetical protein A2893_03385 [Candidatus Woesebacteria bacteri
MKKKTIVVIGGGTGTYTVLLGLKKYEVDLSVIVSMMDSGGSNRVIRDEFGLLPTSDLRQCMVALSSEKPSEIVRELFTYRYNAGTGITGMTFGNLFMAALTDIYGSQEKAIEKTCEFLDVQGKIIPVTYDNTNLVALYENEKQVLGEHAIDEPPEELAKLKIVHIDVFPKAKANPKAIKEIKEADLIVLGPGDLYTSVLPNLVIDGIVKAIKAAKGKVVFVMNLMTRYGQTNDYTAKDYLEEMENYLGKGNIDFVLINNGKIPQKARQWYKRVKAKPVKDNLSEVTNAKIIRTNFVSNEFYEKPSSDRLARSLVRHDSNKLAKAIISLL